MARQIYGCVRNCILATGDNALAKTDKGLLVSVTDAGSYDYGEPAVQKTPITESPLAYGVMLGYDDGAKKAAISTDGLVIVKKDANAVATDVGKRISPSTTIAGHATVPDAGGFGLIVAIENTNSPNLLVDLSVPATDTQNA